MSTTKSQLINTKLINKTIPITKARPPPHRISGAPELSLTPFWSSFSPEPLTATSAATTKSCFLVFQYQILNLNEVTKPTLNTGCDPFETARENLPPRHPGGLHRPRPASFLVMPLVESSKRLVGYGEVGLV